jgi:NAD(P)-dependent dehydrogenase (short-subunit alcohol dehydrogenase family)
MVALVTGASRGIGKAIVLELARLGYDLAIVGRNRASLEKVAEEVAGVRVVPIEADLAKAESAGAIVEQTIRAFGGIDVLINCAGIPQKGPFTEVTPEQWNAVFAVNARAPFFLCQAALPYLKQSSKPVVINISSVVGFKGYIQQSVYSSSKHALAGFTKVFAKEVQPFGIRVHLISPGG